jgi:aconitate hydratase
MLALTFANPDDYDKVKEDDTIDTVDLDQMAPGKPVTLKFIHADGSEDLVKAKHTYNENQIEWLRAGSALNLIRKLEGAE